jgi:DNA (cytosine-5)-methyltransferase 1
VFVVASAREDFDPAEVLFEFEGVRRDIAPSREARKVTPTISSSGTGVSRVGFNCEDEWFIETPAIDSYTPSSIGGYREGVGTLRANGGDIGGGSENLVATAIDQQTVGALCADSHPGAYSGQDAYTGRLIPQAIPLNTMTMQGRPSDEGRMGSGIGEPGDPCPMLTKAHSHAVATPMAVRRLTPTECERLQGFPDGYTNIPWRKAAESPDGPRYKALGNSWAVPVVRWIGERIARAT